MSGRRATRAYDDARFDPPAPVALVTVTSQELGVVIHDVPMLLDTGADVSLLPRSHVAKLVPPDAKQYELEAFDRTRSTAPVALMVTAARRLAVRRSMGMKTFSLDVSKREQFAGFLREAGFDVEVLVDEALGSII